MRYPYHFVEWLLFFYIYCFLGWVWESCYVSLSQKKWVNRGFMHGPFLPIYGSGAIMVLLFALPLKDHLGGIFVSGMIGATLLEYVTGTLMEALFHVRYWDYSGRPYNIKGHICLRSSVAWGFFSILMIKVLHGPVAQGVSIISPVLQDILALLITLGMGIDFACSFNEAMDLKKMLMELSSNTIELQVIRKKLDYVIAIVDTDATKLKEKLLATKQKIEERLQEEKNYYELQFQALSNHAKLESYLEKVNENKQRILQGLSERANTYLTQIEAYTKEKGNESLRELGKLKSEIEEVLQKITIQKKRVFEVGSQTYKHSVKILRRNPSASSKKYSQALQELKEITRRKEKVQDKEVSDKE